MTRLCGYCFLLYLSLSSLKLVVLQYLPSSQSLTSALLTFWARYFLVVECHLLHCKMFSNNSGFYPLDAKITLQLWQLKCTLCCCCSVTKSCPTPCNPMDCSTPAFPVHHQLPELAPTHVHWVSDAIQPSYPLSSPCPPAFNLSQHRGLFQWVSSSYHVAKVLEFQLQRQSFQWIFSTAFL